MTARTLAVRLATLVALCAPQLAAQEAPRWHGVPYTLPAGWTSQATDDVLLLVPKGVAADGTGGEAYGLLFDGELQSLEGEELAAAIADASGSLLEGSTLSSDRAGKIGVLDGRTFRYVLAVEGQGRVELRFHVFLAEGGVASLFAIAEQGKLSARKTELDALLDSIGRTTPVKPKRKPFGLGKKDEGETPRTEAPKDEGEDTPVTEEPVEEERPKRGNPLTRNRQRGEDGGESQPEPKEPGTGAVRLPGGKEQVWCGVAIDLPADWRTEAGEEDALLLLPPDFGQSGVLDEIYALCGDGSLKSLDAEDVVEQLQQALEQIQPGLTLRGAPRAAKFGALSGKEFVFTGSSPDGQTVEARVWAFPTPGGVRALLGLGFPGKLQARSRLVQSMLGSLRAAKGVGKQQGGGGQELVGQWVYFSNFNANNGGGSARQAVITLRANGTYEYDAENCSTNPFGAAWGESRSEGNWALRGNALVFTPYGGEAESYPLEKRNHPKNNDPMIVLDGKTFVTATQRRPW